jgi:hypothetical protein
MMEDNMLVVTMICSSEMVETKNRIVPFHGRQSGLSYRSDMNQRYLERQGCGGSAFGRDFRDTKPTRRWLWRQEASLQRDSSRRLYPIKPFGRVYLLYYGVKAEVVL